MTTTRQILRILCLSVLLNLIHLSMGQEIKCLHQSSQQVLCPKDVGVFHPDIPDVHGPGPVVAVGSDMVYRDIYTWGDKLTEFADVSNTEDITQFIEPCLRGSAAIWWIVELTGIERKELRKASLERWSSLLTKRFGLPRRIAYDKFLSSWYTTQDLNQPPRIWIHQMVQYGKAANIHPSIQLWAIWLQFDQSLQSDIPKPTTNTTLIDFLEKVDDVYPLWVMKSQGYFGGVPASNSMIYSFYSESINAVANAVRRLIETCYDGYSSVRGLR